MIRVIAIEREYGCGGSEIAGKLAGRLGWKLWDSLLTQEIARLAKCAPETVERFGWRRDPAVYRVFKSFLRGAFEGSLPPVSQLELLDAERLARIAEGVVKQAASDGHSIIVGRGSQYFLSERDDTLRLFLYAAGEVKIRRLMSLGKTRRQAVAGVSTIDRERSKFVGKYFGRAWPGYPTFQAALNTVVGDDAVVETILNMVRVLDQAKGAGSADLPDSRDL